jgi:ribose 5-phosphate isomerase A
MTQDELKTLVGRAAVDYVPEGDVIGVGTGSTVNKFLEALAASGKKIAGAVSSSVASTERLKAMGVKVLEACDVTVLGVYIDGADEIDGQGCMIKGGGAALTREKIVAALAKQFVCIADDSKRVQVLGQFPVPVEVVPMAAAQLTRSFAAMGGHAQLRLSADGHPLVTDNGMHILDVRGLQIKDPLAFEVQTSQWPGVVTAGVFAAQRAQVALLATASGVQTLRFAA